MSNNIELQAKEFFKEYKKAKNWIANGAQPTDTVKVLLKKEGVL